MSWILLALVTTILYFVLSFVFSALFTTLTLLLPFLTIIAKLIGIIVAAVAFVVAFLIASAVFGHKLFASILKIVMVAMVISFGFKVIGWLLTPLAALLNLLFPIACIFVLKELIF